MDYNLIFIILGFSIAAYAIVGNDAIQTLGTFISSNSHRPWWFLWAYSSLILTVVMLYGWSTHNGDVSYGRLEKIHYKIEVQKLSEDLAHKRLPVAEIPESFRLQYQDILQNNPEPVQADSFADLASSMHKWQAKNAETEEGRLFAPYLNALEIHWYHVLPPLSLLILTRMGFPVSTTFLILTSFAPTALAPMLTKSLMGYIVAFVAGMIIYFLIARSLETRFAATKDKPTASYWITLQWISTGWLWANWLIQDLANIYVYLPKALSLQQVLLSLVVMVALQGYIFASKGGKIQKIVTSKFNTEDIRSATIIDFIFGIILFIFKEVSKIPMSTTWVFVGLLSGRQLAIALFTTHATRKETLRMMFADGGKMFIGLAVSVAMAYGLNYLRYL